MNEKEYELYLKVSQMTDEEFREAVKKAESCDKEAVQEKA